MSAAHELVHLSRELGREERHLAMLGEGNTSTDLGDGRALRTWHVKAPLSEEPRLFMRLRVVAQ